VNQAYENIKKKSKKAVAVDKMERFKTGGGTYVPAEDEVDLKVLSLLGKRATPLQNIFDGDSEYNSEGRYFSTWLFSCNLVFVCFLMHIF